VQAGEEADARAGQHPADDLFHRQLAKALTLTASRFRNERVSPRAYEEIAVAE
jgi:hypothetical protein